MDVAANTFEREVIERSASALVLVDFWAGWCGPCRMLAPALEQAVAARHGDVVLAKVDVDAEPQLAGRFGIRGIPHVKAFRDGREVGSFTGVRPRAAIDGFIDEQIRARPLRQQQQEEGSPHLERLLEHHRERGDIPEVVEAFELGYHDQALSQLAQASRTADASRRDALRQLMLAAMKHLGPEHPITRRYRHELTHTPH